MGTAPDERCPRQGNDAVGPIGSEIGDDPIAGNLENQIGPDQGPVDRRIGWN